MFPRAWQSQGRRASCWQDVPCASDLLLHPSEETGSWFRSAVSLEMAYRRGTSRILYDRMGSRMRIPAQLCISCVTSGQWPALSVPHFTYL